MAWCLETNYIAQAEWRFDFGKKFEEVYCISYTLSVLSANNDNIDCLSHIGKDGRRIYFSWNVHHTAVDDDFVNLYDYYECDHWKTDGTVFY